MEKSATSGLLGCGSDQTSEITLNIQTTTGGNFFITVDDKNTVEQLKKIVSKKLKVSKDRICLLHRERQLRDGTLKDNGLVEGSRVILLPSVETGLLTQRPENSVMQALESLNDSQVNDFLSGKSPLNLTMRLGDHMMLIQLQLSTLNPGSSTSGTGASKMRSTSSTSRIRSSTTSNSVKERKNTKDLSTKTSESHTEGKKQSSSNVASSLDKQQTSGSDDSAEQCATKSDDLKSFLRKQDIETLQDAIEIFKSLAEMQENDSQSNNSKKNSVEETDSPMSTVDLCCSEQSPIKSLSNLVSSPIKTMESIGSDSASGSSDNVSTTYVPLPTSLHSNLIENLMNKCEASPLAHASTSVNTITNNTQVNTPQYVPLPSSLKNNLIESLAGGNSSVKSDIDNIMCTDSVITDPIAANLTSCLCSTFNNTDYPCSSDCHPSEIVSKTNSNINCDISSSEPSTNEIKEDTVASCSSSVYCNETLDFKSSTYKADNSNVQSKESNKNKRLHYLLHKTSKLVNPISRTKQKAFVQSVVHKHMKKRSQILSSEIAPTESPETDNTHLEQPEETHEIESTSSSSTNESTVLFKVPRSPSTNRERRVPADASNSITDTKALIEESKNERHTTSEIESTSSSGTNESAVLFRVPRPPSVNRERRVSAGASNSVSDTKALIEASKNLTQTLKKLSKEVLTNKVDLADEDSTRAKIGQGAVIESMKHHGKGIYSGTFSGTLNPALQDRFGRPKRDISTIIHILNDLLCATPPQYRRGARITFEPTHNNNASKNKQNENKQETETMCWEDQSEKGECACTKCNNSSCPYGECNGHSPRSGGGKPCLCRDSCNCNKSLDNSVSRKKCMNCSDKNVEDKTKNNSNKNCKKCNSASALALENSKTKCKLDQLRLVMQQKKQKREERKMKAAPYVATNSNVSAMQTENTTPSVLVEEIDSVA